MKMLITELKAAQVASSNFDNIKDGSYLFEYDSFSLICYSLLMSRRFTVVVADAFRSYLRVQSAQFPISLALRT